MPYGLNSKNFSKPQTNEVRACFDLLTSFWQGTQNMDEWYNAIQAQVNLAKYPPETAKILHHYIFWSFMALTEMQKGYVAVELESLAVAWAMEKFHHFLYGNEFTLETDQKPLEAILSKSLNQATPQLQRILIRTFLYNFKIRYIPGVTNHGSRLPIQIGNPKRFYIVTQTVCESDHKSTQGQK